MLLDQAELTAVGAITGIHLFQFRSHILYADESDRTTGIDKLIAIVGMI